MYSFYSTCALNTLSTTFNHRPFNILQNQAIKTPTNLFSYCTCIYWTRTHTYIHTHARSACIYTYRQNAHSYAHPRTTLIFARHNVSDTCNFICKNDRQTTTPFQRCLPKEEERKKKKHAHRWKVSWHNWQSFFFFFFFRLESTHTTSQHYIQPHRPY